MTEVVLYASLKFAFKVYKGKQPVALGIIAWRRELNPAGETTVVFLDSAFADDPMMWPRPISPPSSISKVSQNREEFVNMTKELTTRKMDRVVLYPPATAR